MQREVMRMKEITDALTASRDRSIVPVESSVMTTIWDRLWGWGVVLIEALDKSVWQNLYKTYAVKIYENDVIFLRENVSEFKSLEISAGFTEDVFYNLIHNLLFLICVHTATHY